MPQAPSKPLESAPKPPNRFPVDNDIHKSIEIITKCRDIHIIWADKILKGEKTQEQIEIGGNLRWHQQWIDDYNFVIETLKSKLYAK